MVRERGRHGGARTSCSRRCRSTRWPPRSWPRRPASCTGSWRRRRSSGRARRSPRSPEPVVGTALWVASPHGRERADGRPRGPLVAQGLVGGGARRPRRRRPHPVLLGAARLAGLEAGRRRRCAGPRRGRGVPRHPAQPRLRAPGLAGRRRAPADDAPPRLRGHRPRSRRRGGGAARRRAPEHQPQEDVRVLLDPAGHPFCLYSRSSRPGPMARPVRRRPTRRDLPGRRARPAAARGRRQRAGPRGPGRAAAAGPRPRAGRR